ncbi:MAG: adenylate/guanylate cyclase domain-containing protein [Reinekea sp.]
MSNVKKSTTKKKSVSATAANNKRVAQELELFDDFTVLPISAEFNSRSIIYLTLAGTLVSSISYGVISQLYSLIAVFCVIYPTLTRFISLPRRQRSPKSIGYGLILFDAFFIGTMLTLLGLQIIPSVFLLIMANASFIALGQSFAYMLCLGAMLFGATLIYFILPVTDFKNGDLLTSLIAAAGTGLYVAITAFYTNQSARRLKAARLEMYQQNEHYRELSRKLSKYLSPQVWENIFNGKRDAKLETQRKRLVVFFSDIKGFSELSEQMEPEALTALINSYLTEMSKIVIKHGGTIDKFIGDAIMVFFGDPETKGVKRDAEACVAMAIEMRRQMKVLRQRWRKQGIQQTLEIRMGINAGYCTVGNFGAEQRMDYTLLGKEVNLASRLESAAEPSEILISSETYSLIKDSILCKEKGLIKAKGFSRPIPVYQVMDFRRDLGARKTFTDLELEGFSMSLDMEKVRSYDKDRIIEMIDKVKSSLLNKPI